MKKIFFVLLFGFVSAFVFAAPFGLKMGMTIEEIAEQCENEPTHIKDDIYLVQPIKSHPVFSHYAVYVNEKTCLYQIRAISDSITTNKYGTELQNTFNNVKDRIAKTYGKPKIIDTLDPESIFKGNEYWFYSLREGSRQLYAVWGQNTSLADNLDTVVLECSSVSGLYETGFDGGKGQLILYYYFNNTSSVEDEQDEVF